jgi:hypothetical protein
MRASPAPSRQHDSPEHDDIAVKLMVPRGASMAVQLAPGSLRGAFGRCHAKTPEANRQRSEAIVPFRMFSVHFRAYRAVSQIARLGIVQASRYQKAAFMVGILTRRPFCDFWLAVMHRHTCTCGPDTKVIPAESCAPYFPADCF